MKAFPLGLLAVLAFTGSAGAHGSHETFAAGAPGDAQKAARVIDVTIRERPDGSMSFGAGAIQAARGEQVRFVIKNEGRAPHEFRIDSAPGNSEHKAMMARMPGMAHHDSNAVDIAPGATANLVWRFSKPGAYEYACLIPGHYEAGMHGEIVVR